MQPDRSVSTFEPPKPKKPEEMSMADKKAQLAGIFGGAPAKPPMPKKEEPTNTSPTMPQISKEPVMPQIVKQAPKKNTYDEEEDDKGSVFRPSKVSNPPQ